MQVHHAFRFELDQNNRTRSALSSHAGAGRFAYNWGLALVKSRLGQREQVRRAGFRELLPDDEVERLVRTVEVPWNLPALRKEWNHAKAEVAPWWAENSKESYSSGLDALARALDGFSKARSGARTGTLGFPRFKKKGARRSCRFTTGAIKVVDDRHVQLPRIGQIRTKEQANKLSELLDAGSARILSATISEEAGRWFVSFGCELEARYAPARLPDAVVGVDLGVKHLAALRRAHSLRTRRRFAATPVAWRGSSASSLAGRKARSDAFKQKTASPAPTPASGVSDETRSTS